MGKRLLAVMAVLLSVGLVGFAAGCGDDDDEDTGAATTATEETTAADTGGGSQSVSMVEYAFKPSDVTAASGDTLELTNDGEVLSLHQLHRQTAPILPKEAP